MAELPNRVSLSRNLGLKDSVLLGVGAIIGGGIFTLTGLVAAYAGPALPFVILLNAFIALNTALAYAELSSTFPEAGGGYRWVGEAFGPFAGHMAGWISWFAHAVACSLYALSVGFYGLQIWFAFVLPALNIDSTLPEVDFWKKAIAVVVILLFGFLNFKSGFLGRKISNFITIAEISVILFFIVTGAIAVLNNPDPWINFSAALPQGIFGIFAGAGIMYIAFEGSEIVAQSAEELKDPHKNLPRSVLISFSIVILLYLGTMFVAIAGISADKASWQVLADAGEGALIAAAGYFTPIGAMVVTFGGLLAGLAAMDATIYSSSHVSFAMGRAGQLPRSLGKIHPEKKTPDTALLMSLVIIVLMAWFFPLKDVASVADILFIILFAQLQITVISLRKKYPDAIRPFRVPLYPLPQILALIGYAFIGIQFIHVSPVGLAIVGIWMVVGFWIYKKIARENYKEEFASHKALEAHLGETSSGWHYRIVVPIIDNVSSQSLALRTAVTRAMALRKEKATIYFVSIHGVAPSRQLNSVIQTELVNDQEFLNAAAIKLKRVLPVQNSKYDVFSWVHLAYQGQEAEAILDIVERLNADLLILGWRGWTKTKGKRFGATIDPILHRVKCDLVILKSAERLRAKNILLATGGGAHTQFAASVANAVAKEKKANVRILSVVPPVATEEEISETKEKILEDLIWPGQEPLISFVPGSNIAETILEESKGDDIVIMAASRGRIFKEIFVGNTAETVARHSSKTVIITKHHADISEPIIGLLRKRFF